MPYTMSKGRGNCAGGGNVRVEYVRGGMSRRKCLYILSLATARSRFRFGGFTMQNSAVWLLSKMILNMAAVRHLELYIFWSHDCHKFEICYCITNFIKIG